MSSWIDGYRQASSHRVVGLMSGTSVDGIDAACVQIAGTGSKLRVELEAFNTFPYDDCLKSRILALCSGGDVAEAAVLSFELAEAFASAVLSLLNENKVAADDVDLIASHGQTVAHLPRGTETHPDSRATLQIGEPCIIAERTGITTVADFRTRDIAAGGEGAPLIPYVDYCLLRISDRNRIVQNIGGIANCTILPAGCLIDDVRAWDTGPGNMVIDACVRILTDGKDDCDIGGTMAAAGRVDEVFLNDLLDSEFLNSSPPKSAGREEFGREYAAIFVKHGRRRKLNSKDIIATATALTAQSIEHAYRRHAAPILDGNYDTEVIVGGGGAENPTLMRMLRERIAPWRLLTHEDCGLRSDAKEAIGFAVLGHETIMGVPTSLPGATGARHSAVLGKIVPGRGW